VGAGGSALPRNDAGGAADRSGLPSYAQHESVTESLRGNYGGDVQAKAEIDVLEKKLIRLEDTLRKA